MEDEERYMISIPGNIRLRMEIISGIGIKELFQTIGVGVISAIIAFIINSILKNYLISIGFFIACTGITFLIVMKDKNNQSILDIITNIYKFYKNQKFYKYDVFVREEYRIEKNI